MDFRVLGIEAVPGIDAAKDGDIGVSSVEVILVVVAVVAFVVLVV